MRKLIVILYLLSIVLSTSCRTMLIKSEKEYIHDEIQQAQMYLGMNNFKKAIEIYNVMYRRFPHNSDLRSNYIKAIEYTKKTADTAYDRGDFASAGFIYHILLNNHAQVRDFTDSLSFKRDILHNRINSCSKALTGEGLEKYRAGDLEEAISVWKDVLKFDPENTEVQKAIKTATTQLKNFNKKI
jgi:tetratricopeptide (TPR) repeat protein